MERIYLQKVVQHSTVCYVGKIDPRKLIKIAKIVEAGETQEAQRPLKLSKVKDIAKFVDDNSGILPASITIASVDNRNVVKKCDDTDSFYYLDFPVDEDEIKKYEECIEIMDGQHRLYSFDYDKQICLLNSSEPYELPFTLYVNPSLDDRRRIFISCNEKQDKVDPNLLLYMKYQLGMVNQEEMDNHELVEKLSKDDPLKGHIIMSAEKIKNGVKARQIIDAINKSGINKLEINGNKLSVSQKYQMIRIYLLAWEKLVGFDFSTSTSKEAGTAITSGGLKYMIMLLPCVFEQSLSQQQKFNENFVKDILKQFMSSIGVLPEEFFKCEQHKYKFREKGLILDFAQESITKIKSLDNGEFNPLA